VSSPDATAPPTPGALLRLAGHALPPRYARALARFRAGPGTIKVDWALDGPIPWSAPEARQAGTVHVGGDDSEVLDTTLMHRRSGLPDRPFMLTGQQSERRNRNLVGGDVGGGSYTLDQVIFRPVPSLAPYRTPLRGLYIGSASTFPGGAVHGVPGHAAARLALAESRLPGR